MDKATIRKYMITKRDGIIDKDNKDDIIKKKLKKTEYYKNADKIFIYVGFKSEINTIKYIKEFLEEGKRVFVPRTDISTRTMEAVEIESIEDLEKGAYGILEPNKNKKSIDKNDLELIIFPGLAFDEQGYRIGYGAGYYDKFMQGIKEKVPKVALSYDFQVIDNVPHEEHDVKVDCILTENKEIIKDMLNNMEKNRFL